MLIPIKKRFLNLSNEEFYAFCRDLRDYRIERDAEGTTFIQEPTFSYTGKYNASITIAVGIWNQHHPLGVVFDSNTGFTLPNGAIRSPDTSWIEKSRWDALTEEEKHSFAPICPDFVIEIRSQTDRLSHIQAKMEEYLENEARLGWLIDPIAWKISIYRNDGSVEEISDLSTPLSGEDVLPGFEVLMSQFLESK